MGLLRQAYCGGYECLASWADLLDRINVFPVADADTGTNLRISLAPLRDVTCDKTKLIDQLSFAATGNSGNIAAAFFMEFLAADSFECLSAKAKAGRDNAWKAIASPKPGTMLAVFDSLAQALDCNSMTRETVSGRVSTALQTAVLSTSSLIPDLERAGVVDSGALAMFIFLDAFFQILAQKQHVYCDVTKLFKGKLTIADSFESELTGSYCVDTVINTPQSPEEYAEKIAKLGESVVVVPDKSHLKVHIHTTNPEALRHELSSFGEIVKWSKDEIDAASHGHRAKQTRKEAIHIVTDAAGSVSRQTAEDLGIILLDSYIVTMEESRPESLFSPEQIYSLMQAGAKVTTAQASQFERYQHYKSLTRQYAHVLYLCVGSVYTGNYETVCSWKKEFDPEGRLTVIDSGAASGRLGTVAIFAARYAAETSSPQKVITFAKKALQNCEEYVFIDKLTYLVAGGRLSKTSGFFGDLLHMKPVVSPTADGAKKVGVVRNQAGQVEFALRKLAKKLSSDFCGFIMLQYSNNKEWVNEIVKEKIESLYPKAEIMIAPLSLTSGVHMGPGTWALALLPDWRTHFESI